MRYHTVFDSSLIDMLYYDKDGVLTDINEKACRSFGIPNRQELLDSKHKLEENPLFNNINIRHTDHIHNVAIIDFSQFQDDKYRISSYNLPNKIYYESTLNTLRLMEATQQIQEYVDNINYALRVSGVRLVNYHPDTFTLDIFNNVGDTQLRLSQLRCIRLAAPHNRRAVSLYTFRH